MGFHYALFYIMQFNTKISKKQAKKRKKGKRLNKG